MKYNGEFKFYTEHVNDILCSTEQKYFIDIGVNNYSDFLVLAKYEKWKGIFVEPLIDKLDQLERLNDCFYENSAISIDGDIKKFYTIKEYSEWSSFNIEHVKYKINEGGIIELKVNTITVNNLCKKYNFPYVNILKIDAETYDCDIINSINFECLDIKSIIFEYCGCKEKYNSNKEYLYKNNFELKYQDDVNIIYIKR